MQVIDVSSYLITETKLIQEIKFSFILLKSIVHLTKIKAH